MKVKELIEKLKWFDQNMDVYIYDEEYNAHLDISDLKKEIKSYFLWTDLKPIWSRIDKDTEKALENTKAWDRVSRKNVLTIYIE